MAITDIKRDWGDSVSIVRIIATDTLAQVAASGYLTAQADNISLLNNGAFEWLETDAVLVSASDGKQFFEFDGDDFATLIPLPAGNGEVTLPVVDGDFVNFDGTLGGLHDLGFSASDATKTKVVMADAAVVIGRIAVYTDTDGTISDDAATAINNGNIQAGSSGTAGYLASFPGTAARGSLRLTAVANTGNTLTTISNAEMGQASVVSIPDPGAATGNFLVTGTALVSGNLVEASGTDGLTIDSGVATSDVQLNTNIIAQRSADIGGAGAGPINIAVVGATATSVAVGTLVSSSNAVQVQTITTTTDQIAVTFSGDPGAAAVLNYIVFLAAQ